MLCWVHYAPPITDSFRVSYRKFLRWNDELPFVKFAVSVDERPVLTAELPVATLDRDALGTALVRLVTVCDLLLDESLKWLFPGAKWRPCQAARSPFGTDRALLGSAGRARGAGGGGYSRERDRSCVVRYGAVVRAINVGTHNRIRMDTLRGALVDAGFNDVRSHLQTGNLTLDTDEAPALAVAERIEAVLADMNLRGASVVARAWSDLERLATETPFTGYQGTGHMLTVSFCRVAIPDPPVAPWSERGVTFLGGPGWALFGVVPRDGARLPNPNAIIERRWGIPATTRMWNVITDWVAREATPR